VKKHGLSFEEAAEPLSSDLQLVLFDEDHAEEEVRYSSIGPVARGTIVVVWTERRKDVVRIISARFATPREQAGFLQHMGGRT
jgi:uncharacterized DUF497 family protein